MSRIPCIERQRRTRNTSEPAIDEEADEKESPAKPSGIEGKVERPRNQRNNKLS